MITIAQAVSDEQIRQVQELLTEYFEFLRTDVDTNVDDLDDLPTSAGFREELAGLPGKYAPPDGRLLLATYNGERAGCVGFYKFDEGVCEIKRLWTRPQFRGQKIGRLLVERLIEEARLAGYTSIILSSADVLTSAHALYRSLGFEPTEPYFDGPEDMIAHELFMKLDLSSSN